MTTILFVCTGNVFRSLTAEYALKAALRQGSGCTLGSNPAYTVSSAGTLARPLPIAPYVLDRLRWHGLDPAGHRQRRVTVQMLNEAGLIVAMGLDHRAYLREQFSREAWLFNQICFGEDTPVLDIEDVAPNDPAGQIAHGIATVDYICEAIPYFIRNIQKLPGEGLEA